MNMDWMNILDSPIRFKFCKIFTFVWPLMRTKMRFCSAYVDRYFSVSFCWFLGVESHGVVFAHQSNCRKGYLDWSDLSCLLCFSLPGYSSDTTTLAYIVRLFSTMWAYCVSIVCALSTPPWIPILIFQPGGYKELIKSRLTLSFYEDLGFIDTGFFRSMFDTILSLLTSKPQAWLNTARQKWEELDLEFV